MSVNHQAQSLTSIKNTSSTRAKPTIYLSGPIQNVKERSEAANWRNEIKERYGEELNFLDPMDNAWNTAQDSVIANAAEIVKTDKLMILQSDILFAYVPFPSVGTSMEIMWAYTHGKIVLVWCPIVAPLSAWIIEHAHYIETTKPMLMSRLEIISYNMSKGLMLHLPIKAISSTIKGL